MFFRNNSSENNYLKGYPLKTPQIKRKHKLIVHGTTQMLLPNDRSKRGVLHLYNMISCVVQCDPLIYKGYGCYCGFLGSGPTVDGIDK